MSQLIFHQRKSLGCPLFDFSVSVSETGGPLLQRRDLWFFCLPTSQASSQSPILYDWGPAAGFLSLVALLAVSLAFLLVR
jgi:hypothetical protein